MIVNNERETEREREFHGQRWPGPEDFLQNSGFDLRPKREYNKNREDTLRKIFFREKIYKKS